ncbi:DUF3880 domain-containing protein [Cohnella sp. AR92]|uniref:glycosyltransferase family protein n=1 Tax=Cohnella sp. AR92 TaxID=648716 RepID=UPI00131597E5|nr:DUF3880 domain-containing protein [Cohnella sp. AR92]
MKKASKLKPTATQASNRWLVNQMKRALADKLDPVIGAVADYHRSVYRSLQESLRLLQDFREQNERGRRVPKKLKVLLIEGAFGENESISVNLLEDALRHLVREVVTVKASGEWAKDMEDQSYDLAIVLGGEELPSEENMAALQATSALKAVWLSDQDGVTDVERRLAQAADHVFTQNRENLIVYQSLGCESCRCLPFAADTELYYPRQTERGFGSDVLLVGSLYRNPLLGELARSPVLANLQIRTLGEGWETLGDWVVSATEAEAAEYFNGAKLVVNGSFSLHRAHEISACGAFQLYQERGISASLDSDTHWLLYRSLPEAEELIKRFLLEPDERRWMASRALMDNKYHHSFLQQGSELLRTVFA